MTHLYRIFVRRASVPICFKNIFPVSSTMCVSHYNSLVSGNNLTGSSAVSKPGIMRLVERKSPKKEAEDFRSWQFQKATQDIREWKGKGARPKNVYDINTIGGVMITPQSYGWVLFRVSDRRILDYGGELLPLMFTEQGLTESELDVIGRNLKENIPVCDLYIMETPKYHPKFKDRSYVESLLTRELVVLLNPKCDSPEDLPGKVILQDPKVINSLFGLWLKNERVSAYQKIQRMAGIVNASNTRAREVVLNVLSTENVKLRTEFLTAQKNECELLVETVSLAFLLVFSYMESITAGINRKM